MAVISKGFDGTILHRDADIGKGRKNFDTIKCDRAKSLLLILQLLKTFNFSYLGESERE